VCACSHQFKRLLRAKRLAEAKAKRAERKKGKRKTQRRKKAVKADSASESDGDAGGDAFAEASYVLILMRSLPFRACATVLEE